MTARPPPPPPGPVWTGPAAATVTGGAHLPGHPIAPAAPVAVTPPVVYPVYGIDCSPEAQATRWQMLQDLEARLFSGVSSVSDRNRQVSFLGPDDLTRQINVLRSQLNYCQTGVWGGAGRPRVHYIQQAKQL